MLLASLGAHVWATDINEEELQVTGAALAARGTIRRQDVTQEDDWRAIMQEIRAEFGRLDVLVNNAGIMLNKPFVDTTLELWRRQQAINVESVFLGMRSAFPLLRDTASTFAATPSIINISSVFGIVAGGRFAAYSASKGAVRALTKAVATEFVSHGIRVNSLYPGPTETNLSRDWEPLQAADGRLLTDDEVSAYWKNAIPGAIPMGRPGRPEDMASAIAFLASDASLFITGSELIVDGGYTMN